jgi:hypothetical protein
MGLGGQSRLSTRLRNCYCRGKRLRKCGSSLATTRAGGSRLRGPRLRLAMPAIEKRRSRACLTGNSDWEAGNRGAFWVSSQTKEQSYGPSPLGRVGASLRDSSVPRDTGARAVEFNAPPTKQPWGHCQVPGPRGQSIRTFNQVIQMIEERERIGRTLDSKGGIPQ